MQRSFTPRGKRRCVQDDWLRGSRFMFHGEEGVRQSDSRSVRDSVSNMDRQEFERVAGEVLDTLPVEFRKRIRNVAILVEDYPPGQQRPEPGKPARLLLGLFQGTPRTRKSFFDLPTGPDYVVLYKGNIEAVCSTEVEIRGQIRRTVIHELGHYFGMDEEQLKDV